MSSPQPWERSGSQSYQLKKGGRALSSSATRVRIKRHLPSCPELSRYSVRSQPNALAAPFLLSFCLAPLFFMRLVPKEVCPPPALPPSPRPHAGRQKSCSSQTTARVPLPGSNIEGPVQRPAGEVNINPHQMLGCSCGRGRSGREEAPQPAAAAIIARARKGSHQREVGGGRVPASELASWGQAMVEGTSFPQHGPGTLRGHLLGFVSRAVATSSRKRPSLVFLLSAFGGDWKFKRTNEKGPGKSLHKAPLWLPPFPSSCLRTVIEE